MLRALLFHTEPEGGERYGKGWRQSLARSGKAKSKPTSEAAERWEIMENVGTRAQALVFLYDNFMAQRRFYTKKVLGVAIISVTREEIAALENVLWFIRRRDPIRFRKVAQLHAVLVYPRRGYENAIYMDDDPYIWVCESGTVLESSSAYLAGLLIHEAVHLAQWRRGIRRHSAHWEQEAYLAQRRFLKKIGANDEVVWLDQQFRERWWVRGKDTVSQRSSDQVSARHRRLLTSYRSGTLSLRRLKSI